VFQNVRTSPGAHQTSLPMGDGGSSHGDNAAGGMHHIVSSLRMRWAPSQLLHTSTGRSGWLITDSLHLLLKWINFYLR